MGKIMEWIDLPVAQAIDYFTQMSGNFMDIARTLGVILCFTAICWTSVKLAFGFIETPKAVIGIIAKILFFILFLNSYWAVTEGLKRFSTETGNLASGTSTEKITAQLGEFLNTMQKAVDAQEAQIGKDVLGELTRKRSQVQASIGGTGYGSNWAGANAKILDENTFNQEVERTTQARLAANQSSQVKTLAAIKSVLGTDGAGRYILKDLYLGDTAYLSPNTMLRIAILTAQIMWEKEWTSVDEEWQANDEEGFFTGMTKAKGVASFPLRRIWDMLLVFITMIAVVLAMIFSLIQYVAAIIEFTIIIAVASVCLPFLFLDETKDIAGKIMPSMLAQVAKLIMITICMWYALWAFLDLALNTIAESSGFNLTTFAYVFFVITITWMLTQSAPKVAMALMTGQPQLSMGEMVAAMGTAVAAGTMTGQAVGTAAGMTKAAVPAMARGGANAMGSMAAFGGAGQAAFDRAKKMGLSTYEQYAAAAKAVGKEAMFRSGQGFSSSLQNIAHAGTGGGPGGGGGNGPGSGFSRFGYNNNGEKIVDENGNEVKQGEEGIVSLSYKNARNEHGQYATLQEYMAKQKEMAAKRVNDEEWKAPPPKTKPKSPRPATSGYLGTDFVAPKMLGESDTKALPAPDTIYL